MPLKFRLELDVILDERTQAAVVESAQRLCMHGDYVAPGDEQTEPQVVPSEEIIAGPEDALMELVERNPLLAEVLARVERISCGPAETLPNPCAQASSKPEGPTEERELDEGLDEFESGVYLCRWPNGDVSIVKADNKREAVVQLDEWAGAEPAWLVPLEACMIDFRLNDKGEIDLVEFGEETTEFIWEHCYPHLDEVLSSVDVLRRQGRGPARDASKKIRTAVEHERERLWRAQQEGPPAKTALGRKLQKRLGAVGPVADHYVEVAAQEILRGKAGERGKPN